MAGSGQYEAGPINHHPSLLLWSQLEVNIMLLHKMIGDTLKHRYAAALYLQVQTSVGATSKLLLLGLGFLRYKNIASLNLSC